MSATIQRLDDEPIIIVTHEGHLTLEISESVTAQVAEILENSDVPLYGIIDVRDVTSSFSEILDILIQQSRRTPGTLPTQQGRVVLVGSHVLIRLFQKLLRERRFGGVILSVYYSMDEALAAVRARIEADREE